MNLLLFLSIQAPFHADPHMLTAAAAILAAAGLGTGAYLSRKQFKKLRRKLVWAAIREKWRNFWKPAPGEAGGCLVLILAILLIGVLAVVLWPLALLVLIILLIVWIARRASGNHTRYF